MKTVTSSQLAARKLGLRFWCEPESLKAANHDGPRDSEADQREPASVAPLQAPWSVTAVTRNGAAASRRPEQLLSAEQARQARNAVDDTTEQAADPGHGDTADHDHNHEDDHAHLHDHDHGEGLCVGLLSEQAWLASQGATDATLSSSGAVSLTTPLTGLNQTFLLHSNPGASKTIYLDFNGHTTSGTYWNDSTMGSSFVSPAYSTDADANTFSDSELTTIQRAWQRVAADFSCFDVNVTTQAPPTDWLIKSSSADVNYGIRVVITSYGPSSSTAGGIAYIDSFNWNSDTPCFVYNTSLLGISEAISHEVGHTLGLSHDGTASSGYYQGHGSGETGWAPIMGVGYYQNVTTWDNSTFTGATNTGSGANYNRGTDDLGIITGINGFSYQADLEGNSLQLATVLSITAGAVSQFGTIETAADTDWFRFDLVETGAIDLSFNPYVYASYLDSDGIWGGSVTPWFSTVSDANTSTAWADNGSNLDISVQLLDGSGTTLTSSNPSGLAARLTQTGLAPGAYYLRLDGVGFGTPTAPSPTGYSDYAIIGDYLISGTISGAGTPVVLPVINLALSPTSVSEDGTANLVYTFSRTGDTSAALDVSVSVGGSATAGVDYTGLPSTGTTQTIRFDAGLATTALSLDPTADASVEANETISLTLLSGTAYSLGTINAVTGTITNDDVAAVTAFTASTDVITGVTGRADTFQLNQLRHSLISGSGSSFISDRITNFETGLDRFDSPMVTRGSLLPKPLGAVSALTASAIGTVLNAKGAFSRNGASTFTFSDPNAGTRTFLALNDGTTSFSATYDAIVEITGYSGSLSSLQVI